MTATIDAPTIDRPEAGTDVAILGPVTALTVFGTEGGGGVDAILAKIKEQALAVETDISTQAGRAAVASLAYRIARSKTALDALGEDNYRRWKAITDARARIKDELDALAADVRRPLTDWENAEKARVAAHEAALDAICESPEFYYPGNTAGDLRSRLEYLHAWQQSPSRDWQEFAKRAADALASEIAKTKVALAAAEKREAEAAEAARLAKEKAEQARRERDAMIAAQARREADEAEAARVAATAKARADLEAAAAAAEIARQKAADDAAAAERKRIADAQAKDAAEAAAREANQRHRARIHADAREALQGEGLSFEAATAAVTAIARSAVPHIRVTY